MKDRVSTLLFLGPGAAWPKGKREKMNSKKVGVGEKRGREGKVEELGLMEEASPGQSQPEAGPPALPQSGLQPVH